ncbi:MAG: M24 family metallopeptidase [Planctomycetota bacterium]
MTGIAEYKLVQTAAKGVLSELAGTITSSDSERTIAVRAIGLLADRGITETWYYECPALVLLGSRSCLSISGRRYSPSDELVGMTNLVTVDLSPQVNGIWGDCARSFFIEGGRCVSQPETLEFQRGCEAQRALHAAMADFVRPDTTFDQLFCFANAKIVALGYENLDFLGNLGHSIATTLDERRYIEAGNTRRLDEVGLFTFEPHIRMIGGAWGIKHENVYHFGADGMVQEL